MVNISENRIKNIGVKRDGIKYNSYLISDELNVLIDTVPGECSNILLNNLKEVLEGKQLDYIILNHTEQDRSGALSELIREYPKAVIVSTIAGLKNISMQQNSDFCQLVAKSNQTLKIGRNVTLRFIITHNINWPDSMMTYFEEEKALFSCDAFSKEIEKDGLKDYYDRKLSYLSAYVYHAMLTIKELEIDKIYPGSGDAENNPQSVVEKYISWSRQKDKTNKKIAVIYESMSGNTANAAKKAFELLKAMNTEAVLIDAENQEKNSVLECIYECDGIMFASPTVYRNIPEQLQSIIMSLNHYEMAEKKFAAFGSFGWSGEAPNLIYSYLRARHFDTYKTPARFIFTLCGEEEKEFEKFVCGFCNAVTGCEE